MFALLVVVVWSAVAAFFVLLCRAAAIGDQSGRASAGPASARIPRDGSPDEAHPLELLLEDQRAPEPTRGKRSSADATLTHR
ncbi:MAG TPA: hypothetical protein VHU13_09060 [Solirubrobacteraceae bacterium]|nr:hypothetical protein [Solirubrobacteraceae bacterium]